jgi:hypothetical protein
MRAGLACKMYSTVVMVMCLQSAVWAQQDSSIHKPTLENFLQRQRGLVGKLARNLVNDTAQNNVNGPVRNDLLFSRYEGRVIRNIIIERLDFGTLIADTSKKITNTSIRLANSLHHKSREYVIRNNLFFKKGDRLFPYLLSDNERHLRDQPYLQDAKIILKAVPGTKDSVDVVVRTKDVLSIGGSFHLHNTESADLSVKEDNLKGWGNTLSLSTLYDMSRVNHFGYGADYVNRNIAGSFIDAYAGYKDFANTFNSGRKEEQMLYAQFIKPLVNPYTKWTYSLEAANHVTQNMFLSDSLYLSDYKYHYFNYDAWIGLNTGAYKLTSHNDDNRLRTLVSMRYFKQLFLTSPGKYAGQYFYQYADITGILGAVSVFKQNFYKTQYIYGFGRNEDVPEGLDISFTAGWVNKQQINRPYAGIDIQRYYFTVNEAYYDFTFRAGSFLRHKSLEDLNMLFSVIHYSRLVPLGAKWKLRSLLNASITGQVKQVLNPPLSLESSFGLPEWRNSGLIGGDVRSTLKGESVFFSPFTFINFHFAPFVFGNLCLLTPTHENLSKSDLYSSIGGGIRTRNESLIFGTFELKAFYFPRKNFFNESWRIETNTNIKFKYNSQFIKRPELINVN